jgi:molybdenum cofactor synthesis domain-containing protein
MTEVETVTAAILVIGDEILSGRTKDQNIGYIADQLTKIGIDLREVRIVPDVEIEIMEAVNSLRKKFDYLFTTGGIGPTHDDITANSIAKALGVEISEDPRAIALLLEKIKPDDLNEARRRMARIPHGASLITNKISKAPGFWIENVIVMAGVPAIMQAMLEEVIPRLLTGAKMVSDTIQAGPVPEGSYAAGLGKIASLFPDIQIGSYPTMLNGQFKNQIVVRGKNPDMVHAASIQIRDLIAQLLPAKV